MTTEPASYTLARIINRLRDGDRLTRDDVRYVGRLAESLGVERREREPYDLYLARILIAQIMKERKDEERSSNRSSVERTVTGTREEGETLQAP